MELCNKKEEDHKENHEDEEYFDHQPPVAGYAVEVPEECTLCSLHVS